MMGGMDGGMVMVVGGGLGVERLETPGRVDLYEDNV